MNNKGFAITATIYGFLVLFLIILLSILSVMNNKNNRSVIISEKTDDRLFFNISHTVQTHEDNNVNIIKKRGKYYARIFQDGKVNEDCYFYVPSNKEIVVESNIVKVKDGDPIIIYKKDGSPLDNNNITNIIITRYYTTK